MRFERSFFFFFLPTRTYVKRFLKIRLGFLPSKNSPRERAPSVARGDIFFFLLHKKKIYNIKIIAERNNTTEIAVHEFILDLLRTRAVTRFSFVVPKKQFAGSFKIYSFSTTKFSQRDS